MFLYILCIDIFYNYIDNDKIEIYFLTIKYIENIITNVMTIANRIIKVIFNLI